ncbi:MAG: twin-arginine translocase TatA/TatE family subunit [Bacillota bacterium]
MFGIGTSELIMILIVALIVFGPGKLPQVGNAMGRALAEFRKASREIQEEMSRISEMEESKPEEKKAGN